MCGIRVWTRLFLILSGLVLSTQAFAADRSEEAGIRDLLGPQYGMIEDLEQLANKGDFAAIHSMLADDYTVAIDLERFREECEKLRWKVRDLRIGTLMSGRDFAYAPVRATSIAGN